MAGETEKPAEKQQKLEETLSEEGWSERPTAKGPDGQKWKPTAEGIAKS